MKYLVSIIFIVTLTSQIVVHAQSDSVVVKSDHFLLGEIKSMERGVLTITTAYSKSDFKVKWSEIKAIFSESLFITSTRSTSRMYGKISSPETGFLKISPVQGEELTFPIDAVLYIKSVDKGFLDRISASIDFGFTVTRARNQRQFSARSHIGYITQRWSFDAAFNKLVTAQDEIENISRGDGNITAVHFPRKSWFALARIEYLYNTEQSLNLRTNTLVGGGRDFFKSNALYWRVFGGAAFNNENFIGEPTDRKSAEAWIASELNIFDMGNLGLLSNIFVYPSITEKDRIRTDFRLDLTYRLPKDFYIKTGMTVNYDNQPFRSSRPLDYILQTTFGWSW